eukprot:4574669-Pleurochrysis_carterae.AAC.1
MALHRHGSQQTEAGDRGVTVQGQVGDRMHVARARGGGRRCAPRETAQVGTAPPSSAPDDR